MSKRIVLFALSLSCYLLSLSIESIGQVGVPSVDSVEYFEAIEYADSSFGSDLVGVGWGVIVAGAITNIIGWIINKSEGYDPIESLETLSAYDLHPWNNTGGVIVGIGYGVAGVGSWLVGLGKGLRWRTKIIREEEDVVEILAGQYEQYPDSVICKLTSDVTDSAYYDRIMSYISDSNYHVIKLREERYSNGQIKFIGLKSKHNFGRNPHYYYKIGTWQYFYANGQLKKRIDYNLMEKKDGVYELYDWDGNLILKEQHSHIEYSKVN